MSAPCAKTLFPRDYGTTPEPTILLRALRRRSPRRSRRQRALASGWFFDTNLSSPQVRLRPRTRVRGCGHHVRRGPGPARAIARRCSHIGRPCLENASKPVAQQRDFWLVPVGDQRARVARVVAAVAARFVLVRRDVGVGHFQAAAGDAGLHKRRVEILL